MPAEIGKEDMRRLFSISALILVAALVSGCVTSRATIGLDRLLEEERKDNGKSYDYRCTSGAHRGASLEHKENTILALKAADRDKRYAFVEFDVQYSQDRRIMVFHDRRMLRLFGSLRKIGNTSFVKLCEVTDGEIVAYDEVMPVVKKKLNIEIKSQGDPELDEKLVDEIMADLRARKREKDVLISSISSDVITYVSQNYPEIPTGKVFWLTSSTYLHLDGLTEKLYEDMNATQADYLMLHMANLRNIDDLLRLKPKDKTIVFWDFDDSMYVVHKDLSDRLWGDSAFKTFCQSAGYKITWPYRRLLSWRRQRLRK